MSQENGQQQGSVLRGAGLKPTQISSGLRMQIDMGKYHLYQRGTKVGEVYVEDRGGGDTIEHWYLGRDYQEPSSGQREVTLQIVYVSDNGSAQSIADAAHASGGRYIKAECHLVPGP